MKPRFEYSEYTNTIRILPQNYLAMSHHGGSWVLNPAGALNPDLCCDIVKCITGENRMNTFLTGEKLVDFLNNNITIGKASWYE